MKFPRESSNRSALGIGLAFIIGSAAFFGAFAAARYFRGDGYEPLIPVAKREAGSLDMPLFARVSPLAAAATSTAPASWKLSDHKGSVVVVNYFATWCGPCMDELPELRAIEKEFAPRGVVFVAVSLDHDGDREGVKREQVLGEFLKGREFGLPILLPPEDSMIWKISFPIPQTYLFDKQGRKARSILGGVGGQGVRKSLEELLKEAL